LPRRRPRYGGRGGSGDAAANAALIGVSRIALWRAVPDRTAAHSRPSSERMR